MTDDPRYMRPGIEYAMAKAIEEAGEFLTSIGRTKQWGWHGVNPELKPIDPETIAQVRREMDDLRGALDNLEQEMDSNFG